MTDKIQDTRFQKLNYDPKFQNMSKKQDKVKIDSRFKEMFTSDNYKVVGKTDKYGRQVEAQKGKNKELDQLYYMSDNDDDNNDDDDDDQNQDLNDNKKEGEKNQKTEKKTEKKSQTTKQKIAKKQEKQESENSESEEIVLDENLDDSESEQVEQVEKQQKKQKQKNEKKKDQRFGKKQQYDQDEESDDDHNPYENGFEWNEVSSSDEGIEDMEDEIDEDLWEVDKKEVQYGKDTSRIIALQNYDWVHISSKELMILFTSFCQNIGHIKSVTVYPSQFGKEMMEKENREGPQGIWKKDEEINKEKIANRKNKPMRTLDNRIIVKQDDQYTDLNIEALRKYEKDRLKYFYAIIECDTVKTAVNIYDNCNEQEFELTGIPLDLRFVPEDIQFPFQPKEKCTKLPPITEVKNFTNRSLAHTNVQLTWDEPNFDKFKFLQGKDLNDEDLDKINWDEYLGDFDDSDDNREDNVQEDDDSENEEELQKKQEELKEKNAQIDWRKNFDKKSKSKNRKEDMEIVFMSGFGDIQQNKENREKEAKQLAEESGWEKYLRLKKEKSKARKQSKKQQKQTDEDYFIDPSKTLYNNDQNKDGNSDSDDEALSYDSAELEDPKNSKKNQKKNQKNKVQVQSHEYLSYEEKTAKKKAEKDQKRKERQNLGLLVDDEENARIDNFKPDVEDERFKKVYEQTDYYLDPTSKNYKSKHNKAFLDEQQKQRKKKKIHNNQY